MPGQERPDLFGMLHVAIGGSDDSDRNDPPAILHWHQRRIGAAQSCGGFPCGTPQNTGGETGRRQRFGRRHRHVAICDARQLAGTAQDTVVQRHQKRRPERRQLRRLGGTFPGQSGVSD